MSDPIYLDYNATTPVAPEVLEAMIPALSELWGNPSSAHVYGRRARQAVDRARQQVAELVEAEPDEVVFTSGGTEADNAAIGGLSAPHADRGRHVVISAVEHAAIDEACGVLESRGWDVTRVGVDRDGSVDPDRVEQALRTDTVLVSIIHAQNETGVIQPIEAIARRVRARGIVMHTDTAQSVGKLPVSIRSLGVDALTIAGHKLYAPKGVGALVVRRDVGFAAMLRGAPHESGRRAGTENTPAIVGLGAACALARRELDSRGRHLRAMRDRLVHGLRERLGDVTVHGENAERLPNTASVAFRGRNAAALLSNLDGVATAAGAACHSGKVEPSSVLRAMGVDGALAVSTLRLTVGRDTTAERIDEAVRRIAAAVDATPLDPA